jgi:hypothetical protein
MGKESMNLRDLIAAVITGNTITIQNSTATDLVRMVVGTSGTALNVNLIGGGNGSGGSGTSGGESGGGTVYNVNNINSENVTGVTFNYYRLSGVTSFFLPTATGSGNWLLIKNITSNISTIYPTDSGGTIDGSLFKVLNQYDSILFVDSGSGQWDIN